MIVVEMNYLAVLVGAVVSVAIGALWFSPLVAGRAWLAAIGKTKEQVAEDFSPLNVVWAAVCGFLISYGLARLIVFTGWNTLLGGLQLGILTALTLVAAAIAVNHVFEKRPVGLTVNYALHHLVEFAAIGMLLGAWL